MAGKMMADRCGSNAWIDAHEQDAEAWLQVVWKGWCGLFHGDAIFRLVALRQFG